MRRPGDNSTNKLQQLVEAQALGLDAHACYRHEKFCQQPNELVESRHVPSQNLRWQRVAVASWLSALSEHNAVNRLKLEAEAAPAPSTGGPPGGGGGGADDPYHQSFLGMCRR